MKNSRSESKAERVTVSTLRAQFADLMVQVAHKGEPVMVTKWGRDVAVLIGADEYKRLGGRAA